MISVFMVCFMYLSVCIYIMLLCIITIKLFTNLIMIKLFFCQF